MSATDLSHDDGHDDDGDDDNAVLLPSLLTPVSVWFLVK